tara:strand:+ start:472 stop:693 length:222 start_codon:yes stop_codon:yes gene_type:complete
MDELLRLIEQWLGYYSLTNNTNHDILYVLGALIWVSQSEDSTIDVSAVMKLQDFPKEMESINWSAMSRDMVQA